MSDGEDDFMCEEEEDYGLVSIFILKTDMLLRSLYLHFILGYVFLFFFSFLFRVDFRS